MKDQLPLLLVLCPTVGFLFTLIAVRAERDLVRQLAISNLFCSIILLSGAFWIFEGERYDERETRRILMEEAQASDARVNASEIVNSQMDRRRIDRVGYRWLVIDGLNFWPIFLLTVISGIVCWQCEVTSVDQNWFFPIILLFDAASLTAMMSYNLSLYLIASGVSVLSLAAMLGLWGGANRRALTVRFVTAQFSGGACVMLGFAMLIVAVPWMKIEDSRTVPPISWNIATISYEIQKWTSGNPLAFQYQNEVFPWILLILSIGFGIQFGVFPFHSWLIELLSQVPGSIALLFVSGYFSLCGTGWLRFVMPLSPELMAAFDWLVLVPALGSAIWGSIRALVPGAPKLRMAYLFLSFTGLSLLGCFSFSRVSLSGMWLMQQQLIISYSAAVCVLSSFRLVQLNLPGATEMAGLEMATRREARVSLSGTTRLDQFTNRQNNKESLQECRSKIRSLLMMICLPALGFFASGFMIFSELLHESLFLVLCMLIVGGLILFTINSLLTRYASEILTDDSPATSRSGISVSALIVLLLAVLANVFPQQLLASIEPDFIRVFQKYEPPHEVAVESKSGMRQ